MIQLSDALRLMDEKERGGMPLAFDLKFVSFNKAKQTGGEMMELKGVVKCGAKFSLDKNDMIAVRSVENSHHPIPVHIRLITHFNGDKIFW